MSASLDGAEIAETESEELVRLREWHKRRSSYDEHPAQSLDKWRAYERMPFQIGHHVCVMLTLFKKTDHIDPDLWLHDHHDIQVANWNQYERAAEQLHKQLEGHDCVAFWQAMKAEAEKVIEQWEQAKAQRP